MAWEGKTEQEKVKIWGLPEEGKEKIVWRGDTGKSEVHNP